MARTYHDALPADYGHAKLASMRGRWGGVAGEGVRSFAPRVWPRTPPVALLAMSANSSRATENTTDGDPTQAFHEIGLWQTPAGLRAGPAPNPDPNATSNHWGKIAVNATTRALLGRPGVMRPEEWGTALLDQAAIGLQDYRGELSVARSMLPASLAGAEGSLWQYALSVAAYGSGAGGAANIARRYRAALEAAPSDAERFAALARAVAADPDASTATAHRVLRVWQRIETGRALARDLGDSSAGWFEAFPDRAEGARVARVLQAQAAGTGRGAPGALGSTAVLQPAARRSTQFGWALAAGMFLGAKPAMGALLRLRNKKG